MFADSAPLTRRQMLTTSAVGVAALSLPRLLSAEPLVRTRKIAVTIDDGPAVGAGRDLKTFLRISNALREGFVAEKIPVIMFINERQLNVDGERDQRVETVHRWLDAGLDLGNHTYSHPRRCEGKGGRTFRRHDETAG